MAGWILPALSALGPFIGSGLNFMNQNSVNEENERLTRETNAMNSSIAQENRDFSYKMWKEQTAYNSPQAQMERLKAAGLNPNLVYGQIAESKMSSPPSIPTPTMDAPHYDAARIELNNPLADYQQVRNMQSLNALQNVNIEKAKAEAVSAAADASYKVYENSRLQDSGLIKGDSSFIKTPMRAASLIYDTGRHWIDRILKLNARVADQVTTPAIMKSLDFGHRLLEGVGAAERAHFSFQR